MTSAHGPGNRKKSQKGDDEGRLVPHPLGDRVPERDRERGEAERDQPPVTLEEFDARRGHGSGRPRPIEREDEIGGLLAGDGLGLAACVGAD